MTNPVWAWLARRRGIEAYQISHHLGINRSRGYEPGWCNNRFGQTRTTLPDGRVIAVAGEHEDHYDPDFFIYNDVIVKAPDGSVEIFGYDPAVLPPTDFHTATLVGAHLYLVGNLGYRDARGDRAQVLRLDLRSFAVETVTVDGDDPGWLSGHTAVLDPDGRSVRITGGKICAGERYPDAVDDHVLDLDRLVWTRITDRRWRQYLVARADRRGRLWQLAGLARCEGPDSEQAAEYRAELGADIDLAAWHARYQPPVRHGIVPLERHESDWIHRIRVDDVTVRYVENSTDVQVVVEGPLPDATVTAILNDLRDKLSLADAAEYTVFDLDD